MTPTVEIPKTPAALLDIVLDPTQTVLGDNRETWEQIDAMHTQKNGLYNSPTRDGYAYPHVAEICKGSVAVIKALHALLHNDSPPHWMETRVYKNTDGSWILSTYINRQDPRYCRCSMAADSLQFAPCGHRALMGVAIVVTPTSIGLVTSLELQLRMPQLLLESIKHAPRNDKFLDGHFTVNIGELGHVQSHGAYACYTPGEFLRHEIGMSNQAHTTYTTNVLHQEDARTGYGNISGFMAANLPTIAAHLERMLHHVQGCPNGKLKSKKNTW